MRLLALLLFAAHVTFVPIHLATERHLDDFFAAFQNAPCHDHDADADADDQDGDDHHHPHPASDHTLMFASASDAPGADSCFVLVMLEPASFSLKGPVLVQPVPVHERIRPPGESPPDPRQPRAPPLA